MNSFLRDNGFGIALLLGAASLIFGLILQRPEALVMGIVLVIVGVVARPLEQFSLGRNGFLLKWQRDAVKELQRSIEERVAHSDSWEAKVIRGEGAITVPGPSISGQGDVVVRPEPARLRITTYPPNVIVTRPQSPREFAEMVIEQVIEPALTTNPPDVRVEPARPPDAPEKAD